MFLQPTDQQISSLINPKYLPIGLPNWKTIVKELVDCNIGAYPSLIAAAATIKVETASHFMPLEEMGNPQYFLKEYGHRHDFEVDNQGKWLWRGRGYIQLTGRYNYIFAGHDLNIPLEKQPNLACRPDIAVKIFRWYWNKQEIARAAYTAYRTGNPLDWKRVRCLVNGENPNGVPNGLEEFMSALQLLNAFPLTEGTVPIRKPQLKKPTQGSTNKNISPMPKM